MDKNLSGVLNTCIRLARKGGAEISVFDLIYETGVPYPQLKEMLDKLVSANELAVTDIKTYKFTGDINREIEEPEVRKNSGRDPLEERRALLERRRQEILSRMKRQSEEEDDDLRDLFAEDADGDEDTDEELRHCDDDEELDKKFAEYERYLSEQLPDKEDIIAGAKKREEAIGFMITLFREGRKNAADVSVPVHAHWDNEEDFLRFCAERITELIAKDKDAGRKGVINKAVAMLENLRKEKYPELTEVFERIVYELRRMSNYYFNKIREQCP